MIEQSFSKISLQRRYAQTVENGASSHKTNYIEILPEILNLEGHINRCIGSKVTAILLNWWFLPTCGVASGRVCPAACAVGLFLQDYARFKDISSENIENCMIVSKILAMQSV